jgi:hypothetical protein
MFGEVPHWGSNEFGTCFQWLRAMSMVISLLHNSRTLYVGVLLLIVFFWSKANLLTRPLWSCILAFQYCLRKFFTYFSPPCHRDYKYVNYNNTMMSNIICLYRVAIGFFLSLKRLYHGHWTWQLQMVAWSTIIRQNDHFWQLCAMLEWWKFGHCDRLLIRAHARA